MSSSSRRKVGIEKIWAYGGSMALDMEDLCRARGAEAGYAHETLMVEKRAVNPCWEDPVTMAVNAAKPMLTEEDRQAIELLVVASESSPDQGKPMSTFVHRFVGIGENCRNFEVKHACYGGTSALMTAAHWVASGAAGPAKALVIATDQGRNQIGFPSEYVHGAGAVAMLISDKPDVLELELESCGYWTKEVGDTFRPTSRHEAGNTENSVYCYLEALEGAYDHFVKKAGGTVDFETYFKKNIYHVPFGAMAYRAHRTLLKGQRRVSRAESEEHFERRVKPALRFNAQVGGTYTAAIFYALLGLIDGADDLRAGDRIGVFSYGSGSCAEFYSARIGPAAKERVRAIGLQAALDARKQISVEQYEAIERERDTYIDEATYELPLDGLDGLYQDNYAGKGLLTLRGLKGFFREYGWS